MEVLEAISEYLEYLGLHRSAYDLRRYLNQNQVELPGSQEKLLSKIKSALNNNKESEPQNSPITPEQEAVMEGFMSKLISTPSINNYNEINPQETGLSGLKAFHKMVKCAEQLFFESESRVESSEVSKTEESLQQDLPHFGNAQEKTTKDEFENSRDESVTSKRTVDEFEDEDDPGFDLFECFEEDIDYVSKQLAQKYQFPERAIATKKPVNQRTSKVNTKEGSYLPSFLEFPSSDDKLYPMECEGITYDCFNLKVVSDRERTGFEEVKDFPIEVDTVIAGRYQIIEYLGSAAFSRAVQCLDLRTKEHVCVKIIENNKDYVDQSIDEIKILRLINKNGEADSKSFLKVIDYFYYKEHLFIVTELLRDNLYEFYRYNREHESELYFTLGRLQRITYQILTALEYVHSLHLIHCDLKPENILIKSYSRCEVKVIDFGSSCFFHDHLSSYVQSRSYRAPEVILGCKYDSRIDIWSLGCIVAELWTGNVLFQNDSVQGLLARVMSIVGGFPEDTFRTGRLIKHFFTREKLIYTIADEKETSRGRTVHVMVPKKSSLKARLKTDDKLFLDFVSRLLDLDKDARPTASEALKHPWITQAKYPDGLNN